MQSIPELTWFECSAQTIFNRLPSPVRTEVSGQPVYRFQDRTIEAAIALKLGRYISGLHAGMALLNLGFLQELGALQRSLQDFGDDVQFLSLAKITDTIDVIHNEFLQSFWEESSDYSAFKVDPKGRPEIPRKKIHNYLVQQANGGTSNHNEIVANKYLGRMYSGYVHGAAPNTLDMYNPISRTFEVSGSTSEWLFEDHSKDFENHLFRGVLVIEIAARAFGLTKLASEANSIQKDLAPYFQE